MSPRDPDPLLEEADRLIAQARARTARIKRALDVLLWGIAVTALVLLATGHR